MQPGGQGQGRRVGGPVQGCVAGQGAAAQDGGQAWQAQHAAAQQHVGGEGLQGGCAFEQDLFGLDADGGFPIPQRPDRQRVAAARVGQRQGQGLGGDQASDTPALQGELAGGAECACDQAEAGERDLAGQSGNLGQEGQGAVAEPRGGAGQAQGLQQARCAGVVQRDRTGQAPGGQGEGGLGLQADAAAFRGQVEGYGVGGAGGGQGQRAGSAQQGGQKGAGRGQGGPGRQVRDREIEQAVGQAPTLPHHAGCSQAGAKRRGVQPAEGQAAGIRLRVQDEAAEGQAAQGCRGHLQPEVGVCRCCAGEERRHAVRRREQGRVGEPGVEGQPVQGQPGGQAQPRAGPHGGGARHGASVQCAGQVGQGDAARAGLQPGRQVRGLQHPGQQAGGGKAGRQQGGDPVERRAQVRGGELGRAFERRASSAGKAAGEGQVGVAGQAGLAVAQGDALGVQVEAGAHAAEGAAGEGRGLCRKVYAGGQGRDGGAGQDGEPGVEVQPSGGQGQVQAGVGQDAQGHRAAGGGTADGQGKLVGHREAACGAQAAFRAPG